MLGSLEPILRMRQHTEGLGNAGRAVENQDSCSQTCIHLPEYGCAACSPVSLLCYYGHLILVNKNPEKGSRKSRLRRLVDGVGEGANVLGSSARAAGAWDDARILTGRAARSSGLHESFMFYGLSHHKSFNY